MQCSDQEGVGMEGVRTTAQQTEKTDGREKTDGTATETDN